MEKLDSNLSFRLMSYMLKIRDLMRPRKNVLKGVGIEPGFYVLDYGCGPGSYIVPTVRLTGESGKVYALDIHPMAIKMVRRIAEKRGLKNVEAILSDCETGLPDNVIDAVLLYDIFHDLEDRDGILKELHRVLKKDGIVSLSDHHMTEEEILSQIPENGLFVFSRRSEKTYIFSKQN